MMPTQQFLGAVDAGLFAELKAGIAISGFLDLPIACYISPHWLLFLVLEWLLI